MARPAGSTSAAQRRIADRIARIQSGLLGDLKQFDGLTEFRVDYGPGYRLYAVRRGDVLIILLCGGDKSSQDRDIRKAQDLAAQLEPDKRSNGNDA